MANTASDTWKRLENEWDALYWNDERRFDDDGWNVLFAEFRQRQLAARNVTDFAPPFDSRVLAALMITAFEHDANHALLVERSCSSMAMQVTAPKVFWKPRAGLCFEQHNSLLGRTDVFAYNEEAHAFVDDEGKGSSFLRINGGALTTLFARLADTYDANLDLVKKAYRGQTKALEAINTALYVGAIVAAAFKG